MEESVLEEWRERDKESIKEGKQMDERNVDLNSVQKLAPGCGTDKNVTISMMYP